MGIMKDAKELLTFIYNQYTDNKTQIKSTEVREFFSSWDADRINRAIDYLRDIDTLKIHLSIGNTDGVYNFFITGLTPYGIKLMENKEIANKEFKSD